MLSVCEWQDERAKKPTINAVKWGNRRNMMGPKILAHRLGFSGEVRTTVNVFFTTWGRAGRHAHTPGTILNAHCS